MAIPIKTYFRLKAIEDIDGGHYFVVSKAFGWGAAIEFVSIAEISELVPP